MVLMNNLGLSIDGVSQIGTDNQREQMTIRRLRKFMNLVEGPLVTSVSGLASADVATDTAFEIPAPGDHLAVEHVSSSHDDALRKVFGSITESVKVRLMSNKSRPLDLPPHKCKSNEGEHARKGKNRTPKRRRSSRSRGGDSAKSSSSKSSDVGSHKSAPNSPHVIGSKSEWANDDVMRSAGEVTSAGMATNVVNTDDSKASNGTPTSSKGVVKTDALDNSFLASTLKTEWRRLHTGVSALLRLEEAKPAAGLIMYFHGSGFVSQSSQAHAAYLKEWCADVEDSIILSVDYRLAPEHKFPVAVHECLYSYLWALQNAARIGTLAQRVVFCGDSSGGGNLAVATAILAGDIGLRGPDGVCVAYPSLYVHNAWSPSRLLSFFDPMLPLSVLELCLMSYVPEGEDGSRNAIMSPVVASEEQLRRLCPVTVICGSLDPLLDDSALFVQRLHDMREGDVLRVYEGMPHGFLNMNQVNVTARNAMRFMAKMIATYLGVPLRKGSKSENVDGESLVAMEDEAAAGAMDR